MNTFIYFIPHLLIPLLITLIIFTILPEYNTFIYYFYYIAFIYNLYYYNKFNSFIIYFITDYSWGPAAGPAPRAGLSADFERTYVYIYIYIYIYTHTYIYIYIHIYIYIYTYTYVYICSFLFVCLSIYHLFIYLEREGERDIICICVFRLYPAAWKHGWSKHGSSIIPSKHSTPQDLYSLCLNLTVSARTMLTPTMFSRRRI